MQRKSGRRDYQSQELIHAWLNELRDCMYKLFELNLSIIITISPETEFTTPWNIIVKAGGNYIFI